MTTRSAETARFFQSASRLQDALRLGLVGEALSDLYLDIEHIHFTTDNPLLRARCEAILDKRDDARELTREPFFDDQPARYFGQPADAIYDLA